MLKWSASWAIHMKLHTFWADCAGAECFNELALAINGYPLVLGIMQCQEGNFAPIRQVVNGIHGGNADRIKHRAVLLPAPTSGCAFHYCSIKGVGAGQANQSGHSARTHSAQGALASGEFAGCIEISKDCINFIDYLLNHAERLLWCLPRRIKAFAVTGQINRTGSDACACKSKVATRVKFLGDGAAVHPDE